ncbi:aspartyl-tRNA(Asn)/glutamyl-tRNA(Gln) amidotransferase subunit A [Naumannella cuiyingiana]|uniref:Aspartyl-tRNA(Asn)/glutamyl-tRNA(Gln) amidotransferase subunit A n=1 Tax=Naumannella cuiyingiana TaxID=1347891 RepID=A0A7Z0D922_9ACTN|nr:amidase family protein [Naumannella cuiyingiana]NYI70996.1 aspartyl-tRNA(Asn)/glutamyl-tRNA(Gln) amidotransferase subunit A [Naumannella cuiyingiana]
MSAGRCHTRLQDVLQAAGSARDVFLQITASRAESEAAHSLQSAGKLAGVAFAVKDVFDVRGTRTSGGSQLFDHRPPAMADAAAVARLSAAGGVLVGKTTLSELAYSGLGVNERFGTPTMRIAGKDHLVGGSSSGSAAAVRAGIVSLALASDTSGSTRIPAAWTGVFGFRPTLDRYPRLGMMALARSLDAVGVVAASLALINTADEVLADDHTALDPPRSPPPFVVPAHDQLLSCDPRVTGRFLETIEHLRQLGLRIHQRPLASLDAVRSMHQRHLPIVEAEALRAFGTYLALHPDRLGPAVRSRLESAGRNSHHRSARPLVAAMPSLRAQFRRELGRCLLLIPPVEIDPPQLAEAQTIEAQTTLNHRALRLPMIFSYLDAPSLVLPVGQQGPGSPRCLQVTGASGHDRRVLHAALHLQSAVPSHPSPSFKGESR